jgi:hypothetical protein
MQHPFRKAIALATTIAAPSLQYFGTKGPEPIILNGGAVPIAKSDMGCSRQSSMRSKIIGDILSERK